MLFRSIGISEIIYDIKSWEKIAGGLGGDEREIKHWIERHREVLNLEALWREAKTPKKLQPIVLDSKDTDFTPD